MSELYEKCTKCGAPVLFQNPPNSDAWNAFDTTRTMVFIGTSPTKDILFSTCLLYVRASYLKNKPALHCLEASELEEINSFLLGGWLALYQDYFLEVSNES